LILAGVASLLAFDLLFLPWFEVSIGLGGTARPPGFQEGRHPQHRVFTNA